MLVVAKRTVAGVSTSAIACSVSSLSFNIARALSTNALPCGVSSTGPPFERATRVCPTRLSSFWICNVTADCVRPTRSAALVKLASSAMNTSVRRSSRSRAGRNAMNELSQ